MIDERIIDAILLTLLALTAIGIVRMQNLLATAMLAGIFSLLGACWMVFLDAPDVAFTEAAVGAGVSTVLFVATLCVVPGDEKSPHESPLALFVVIVTGAVLVYASLDMPTYGDPDAPAHQHPVTRAYVASAQSPDEPPQDGASPYAVGIPNTVTTVLASFRGYDTMGEAAVIFTAGIGVLVILGGARHRVFARSAPADDASEGEG